jgi:hypothetical protein
MSEVLILRVGFCKREKIWNPEVRSLEVQVSRVSIRDDPQQVTELYSPGW